MDLVLIEPHSNEWEVMWNWVANHPLNKGLEDPSTAMNNGEAWQYMGSWMLKNKVIHSFRHRCHPYKNDLVTLSVNASTDFNDEHIAKKFKL